MLASVASRCASVMSRPLSVSAMVNNTSRTNESTSGAEPAEGEETASASPATAVGSPTLETSLEDARARDARRGANAKMPRVLASPGAEDDDDVQLARGERKDARAGGKARVTIPRARDIARADATEGTSPETHATRDISRAVSSGASDASLLSLVVA